MHRRTERDPRTAFLAGSHPADSTCGRTRPRLSRVLALVALLLGLGSVLARPAAAAPQQDDDGHVAVVEVSGLLDRVLVDFVTSQLDEAEEDGALTLVL